MDLKNFLIIVVCIILLVAGTKSCNSKKSAPADSGVKQEQAADDNITLTGLDGINYSIKDINPSTITYLQTKSEYKDLYTEGKKFAVYYVGADCPYAQAFIDNVDPLKTNPEYTDKYNFYAEEAAGMKTFSSIEDQQADMDFSNNCHEFCIVNPAKGKMFAIDGIGYDEAQKLGSIFEQLKDW